MLILRWNFERLRATLRLNDRRRVDFLIAGSQKGGTTALDSYLRSHPEVCMATRKEAHFFDNEEYFHDDKPDYAEYHSLFKPKWPHKIVGEATPVYMYWKSAPGRIWQYNPHMKIIVILRNPIERAYSQWNMQRERNKDSLPFWEAVHAEPQRSIEFKPYQQRLHSYVDRGFYVEQLQRLWNYFPKQQTLIMINEDLRSNPKEALDKVCEFLGIRHFGNVEHKDVSSGSYVSTMTGEEREYLKNVFNEEIRELEHILERDLSRWT